VSARWRVSVEGHFSQLNQDLALFFDKLLANVTT